MHKFAQNIISIYKDKGRLWLNELPKLVQAIAVKWDLRELSPVNNLSFNYVLSGYQKELPIILKLSLDDDALTREAAALKTFAEHGGVKILNATCGALLLERAIPGTSLKDYPKNNATLKICCNVVKRLHQAPLPQNGFPHIRDWLATIDKDWNLPSHFLAKARQLKKELLATNQPEVFLHGDLHRDNILSSDNEWKIIDPKGVIGYAINEVWAFIDDIEVDAPYVAKVFNFDARSVIEWYFVHLVLAACWSCEDEIEPKTFLGLIKKTCALV